MLFIFNLKSCLRQSEKVDIYLWLIVVVQSLSCVHPFSTLWTAALQASLPFTVSQSLLMSIESVMLSNHPISGIPCPQSFPASGLLFQWASSLYQAAKVLELQQHYQYSQWIFKIGFLSDWLVWSPCSTRDSQESSSAPQFESINSSELNLLYGPAHVP